MRYIDKKLKKLSMELFNIECNKANLLYKLDQDMEKERNIKAKILSVTNYPNEVEVYNYYPYTLRVLPGEVEVYTHDQYEKIEGFVGDNEKFL